MCALAPHHPFPPQLRHYCAAHGVAQPGRDSVSRGCRSRRELERQVIRMTGVRARYAAALAKRARVDAVQYRDHTPVPHIAAQTWPNSLAPCNQSRIHPRCHVFEERGRMRVKRRPLLPPPTPSSILPCTQQCKARQVTTVCRSRLADCHQRWNAWLGLG